MKNVTQFVFMIIAIVFSTFFTSCTEKPAMYIGDTQDGGKMFKNDKGVVTTYYPTPTTTQGEGGAQQVTVQVQPVVDFHHGNVDYSKIESKTYKLDIDKPIEISNANLLNIDLYIKDSVRIIDGCSMDYIATSGDWGGIDLKCKNTLKIYRASLTSTDKIKVWIY